MKFFSAIIFSIITLIFILSSCTDHCSDCDYDLTSTSRLKQDIVTTVVTTTAVGLGNIFDNIISNQDEQQDFCRFYIDSIFFFPDNSGYFFIEDMQANMVAHGINKELIGENRYDVEDANGKLYVREMIEKLDEYGFGSVEYYFLNPVSKTVEPKWAYVKTIGASGLFAGSGFYTGEDKGLYTKEEAAKILCGNIVECASMGFAKVFESAYTDTVMQLQMFRSFAENNLFFEDNSGYFFIYNVDGTCLAHPMQHDIEGVNRLDHTDSKGNLYIKEMCDLVQSHGLGFVDYYKKNFIDGNDEKKTSFIMAVPGTDYFIGAGVYFEKD